MGKSERDRGAGEIMVSQSSWPPRLAGFTKVVVMITNFVCTVFVVAIATIGDVCVCFVTTIYCC